jgi:site-specific DNA recombinase
VEYCGRRLLGRHDQLIDRDTFDRAQVLMASRSVAGDQPSRHEHYLRGSLYCAECGGRLLYTKNRGKGGLYEYFSCTNRYTRRIGGRCHSPHYPTHLVERAVEQHYRTVSLTKQAREATYLASTPLERRLLNQAFFKRILIGEDNEVLGTTLTPVYDAVAHGTSPWASHGP